MCGINVVGGGGGGGGGTRKPKAKQRVNLKLDYLVQTRQAVVHRSPDK